MLKYEPNGNKCFVFISAIATHTHIVNEYDAAQLFWSLFGFQDVLEAKWSECITETGIKLAHELDPVMIKEKCEYGFIKLASAMQSKHLPVQTKSMQESR